MSLLPFIWIAIIAFAVVMYVTLDGFTLGTGLVSAFLNRPQRDIATSVILPTWDGNQTWLVLGGASLYGAFPAAFSTFLPQLYIPVIAMVVALLFRGVAFEFRLKSSVKGVEIWDRVFAFASLFAVACQGVVLGNFVQGFNITTSGQVLPFTSLFSPFVLMCAVSLLLGYLLLGSTRLIIKTTGDLQKKMYHIASVAGVLVILCILIISIWTPYVNNFVYQRWFGHSNWLYLMILPWLTVLAFVALYYGIFRRKELIPYWASIIIFLCGYLGFIVSLFPYIVPYKMTIWEAAAPNNTLAFLLVGAVIMLPVLLLYTGYSYYIFRGKVTDGIEY